MSRLVAAVIAGGFVLAVTCSQPRDTAGRDVLAELPAGLDVLLPVPGDNPLSHAKVALGRRLFHEPRLSRDGTMSCTSCHRPEFAFSDGRRRAVGIGGQVGRRNTPSLVNAAYQKSMFWDGRVRTLEQQALLPIENPLEMGHSVAAVLGWLRSDSSYARDFEAAFGADGITARNLARAIAAFERTLVAGDTAFDRQDLTPAQRRGLALFEGRARCRFCHEGRQFTDGRFHNTGVGWGEEPRDLGRFEATGTEADRGRFRTPSLRGLAFTAPYMHDGSFASLRDVVAFYDRGGGPNPFLDKQIRPLGLTGDERSDLVAFLAGLSPLPAARR